MSSLDFGIDINKISSIVAAELTDLDDTNFFGIAVTSDDVINEMEDTSNNTPTNHVLNPLFVSTQGGSIFKMDNYDVYKKYDRVIVISLSKSFNPEHQKALLSKYIDANVLSELKMSLCFFEAPMKMLKLHKKTATVVERNMLSVLNNNSSIEFNNDEVVIYLHDLTETDAKLYVDSLFRNNYDFDKLTKVMLLFLRYNGDLYGESLKKNLTKYINSLNETTYWENKYNCEMNMTDAFLKRTFAKIISKDNTNTNTSDLIRKIVGTKSAESTDYLQGAIENVYKKASYVDGATATKNKKSKYKLYNINRQNDFTKEQVTELFQVLTDNKLRYDLFNAFLLSKDHCHLVLNNGEVLKIMNPTISKFMPLYKLLFGYAWIALYTEECIKKTRTTDQDRYVFSIDDASMLPDFPYNTNDIHTSPYIALLVATNAINAEKNCIGLGQIKSGFNGNQNAISTLSEFKTRFNLFTSGRSDRSIFDGLKTDDKGKWLDFAVSGSVLTACVQKNNPLGQLVTDSSMDENTKILKYFGEYYKKSDIDVICTKSCIYEFMDKVQELRETVIKNLNEITGKDVSNTIKVTPNKSLRIAVTTEYIERCMTSHKVDDVVKNLNSSEIRDHFYFEYMNIKMKLNKNLANVRNKNPLYNSYLKPIDYEDMILLVSPYKTKRSDVQLSNSDYNIFLNDILPDGEKVKDEDDILIFKMSEGIKFKIDCNDAKEDEKYLPHALEIFKGKFTEVFSLVSRFHLPCVRGYYCGNDVKLLPSCVTAMKTGLNMEYKYFASKKSDPIHIANKYRSRGLGIILNASENNHLVEYNKEAEEWKNVFKIDKTNVSKHLGFREVSDEIFKVSKHHNGGPDAYKGLDYTYIKSMKDLYEVYKAKYGYDPEKYPLDLLKLKTINENGSIRPFNRAMLDVAWDFMK